MGNYWGLLRNCWGVTEELQRNYSGGLGKGEMAKCWVVVGN